MFKIYGFGLFGLYMAFVVIRALQTGVIRNRGRAHTRAEEPKTYWLGVTWSAVMGMVLIGYAVWEWLRTS